MRFRILHYENIDSTNNLARTLALEGAKEGTVVWADYQSHGRGRFKRRWVSARRKNLLFSLILRPRIRTGSAAILTHLAARAVQDVLVRDFGFRATLKRPNDVLVNKKKIAGILTESSSAGSGIEFMVVGIGLNVNSKRSSIPKAATSILLETGKEESVARILEDLLVSFRERYKMAS